MGRSFALRLSASLRVTDVQLIKLVHQPAQAIDCNSEFDETNELELHVVETTTAVRELSLPATLLSENFFSCSRPANLPLRRVRPPSALKTTAITEHVTKTLGPHLHILRCLWVPPEPHLDRRDDFLMQQMCFPVSVSKQETVT